MTTENTISIECALQSILREYAINAEVPELRNPWNPQQPILDAEECRKDLDAEEWQPSDYDDETQERRIYLGTIMRWYPSGKVYAPWSTNVSEAEAAIDEAWREALEKEAAALGCGIEHGEGDPCDMYLVETREQPEDGDEDERLTHNGRFWA